MAAARRVNGATQEEARHAAGVESPLRAELFSAEQMERHGAILAQSHHLQPNRISEQLLRRLSERLPDDAVVYDVVYAPIETDLLAQARDRDLETIDGLEMLVGQAAVAFELFFGTEPPRDRDEELRDLLTA